MSLSHCIHQTLNSKASTRFHSGGLQQSCTVILNTFLFGVIILIANILKRAFSSQLAAKLRNRLLVFFFSSRRRHTRSLCDWSSDVCSSDLSPAGRTRPGQSGRGVGPLTCRPQSHSRSGASPRS